MTKDDCGSLTTRQNGKWLRTKDVAHYLGTTEGGIRNMVYRGQLIPRKFNGRCYFAVADIDRQIEASKPGGYRVDKRNPK